VIMLAAVVQIISVDLNCTGAWYCTGLDTITNESGLGVLVRITFETIIKPESLFFQIKKYEDKN